MKVSYKVYLILFLIFVCAFLLRLRIALLRPAVFGIDGMRYFLISQKKSLFEAHFPPFYPLLIRYAYFIVNKPEFAVRLVSVIFGSLLIFPVYFLANAMAGTRNTNNHEIPIFPLFTSALVAIYPKLIDFTSDMFSESVYIFFTTVIFCFIWIFLQKELQDIYCILAGIITGLAYLTRHEGVTLLFCFAIIFFIKKKFSRDYFKKILLVFLGFLIVAFPYIKFLSTTMKGVSFSGKAMRYLLLSEKDYFQKMYGLSKDKTKLKRETDEFNLSVTTYLLRYPFKVFMRMYKNFRLLYTRLMAQLVQPILLVFAGAFFMYIAIVRKISIHLQFMLFIFLQIIFLLPGIVLERFYLFILPVFIIYGIAGLFIFFDCLVKNRKVKILAMVFILIISVFYSLNLDRHFERHEYDLSHKEFAIFLKELVSPHEKIMVRTSVAPYYAGMRFLNMPYSSVKDAIIYAIKNGCRYILVDNNSFEMFKKDNLEGLKLLIQVKIRGNNFKLYKIVNQE